MSFDTIIPFGNEIQFTLSLLDEKSLFRLKDAILFGLSEKWYERDEVDVSAGEMNYVVWMINWELDFRRTGIRRNVMEGCDYYEVEVNGVKIITNPCEEYKYPGGTVVHQEVIPFKKQQCRSEVVEKTGGKKFSEKDVEDAEFV